MPEKKTLKVLAYDEIRRRILSCDYAPGTMLNEELLQEDLHVSRTPIRDALSRLEQEGLIKILPKRGILVADLTLEDIEMVYEVRCMYEPYTILHYGANISLDDLFKFKAAFSDDRVVRDEQLSYYYDDSFHAAVMSASPNRYLMQSYDLILSINRRFRVISGRTIPDRLRNSANEHIKIIDALLAGDLSLAASMMTSHLSTSREATLFLCKNRREG